MTTQSQLANTSQARPRRRMRKVWIMSLVAIFVMAAPLVITWQVISLNAAYAEFNNGTNPRASYWRDVREGSAGYTAIKGQETNVLIENGGQNWRQTRNGPVATLGGWFLGLVVVAALVFHTVIGRARLEQRTGRKVARWTVFERTLHWYVAVLFIILALTGLSLLYGRAVLIPVFGYAGFAAYAEFAKFLHDYLSLFFVIGLVVMLITWFRENLYADHDWEWFKLGGGYLGKKEHAHAHKINAGEKSWFWILFVAGIGLMISGVVLLFPNLGFERATMQGANIIHAVTALILCGFAFGHIYLGTLGSEGALEAMITGEVDEAWAKQHHDLWYEEVKDQQHLTDIPAGKTGEPAG